MVTYCGSPQLESFSALADDEAFDVLLASDVLYEDVQVAHQS